MANTITSLIPNLYAALDVVSRELVGFIPSVTLDATVARAAVGQQVLSYVTPVASATDITPGVTPPDDGDQTIGNIPISISKAKRVPFRWNGEQTLGINNNGPGVRPIQGDQVTQAVRTLCNLVEADVAALALSASRWYGTPGTTAFATDLSAPAQLRKILDDNGAPGEDRQLVFDTTAGAAVRTLAQLTKANEAGTTTLREQGILLDIHNFKLRESAQVTAPAAGTGASGTTNTAGYAVGATTITLAATGTGTVVVGDVVTFTGDTNQYGVVTGNAAISAGGTIILANPGLKKAIPASATAFAVKAQGTRNIAFSRNALILAHRLPALPDGGDLAIDRTTITDPRSGLSFEIAMYPQYRQMQYEISCAWGCGCVKAEHMAGMWG